MSRPHEQKHFLHNRSYCRYCDCPQSSRIVLGTIFAREFTGRTCLPPRPVEPPVVVLHCGRLISHASFTRDAVIYVFENALYVTERHERPGAFCEP